MSRCIFQKIVRKYSIINWNPSLICISKRTLLTPAYHCKDAWAERLKSPMLTQINAGLLAIQLQDRLEKEGTVSAIDIDVLANKLEEVEAQQLDFAQNLFKRFQHTQQAIEKMDSTPHALIRSLLSLGETDRLLEMLQDKLEYGIFLDPYTACLTLDHFIEAKEYHSAAQIAFEQMLQEDFSHHLTKALSWYACHQHWRNPVDVEEETTAEDEEEEEIKYIKVDFIEDPWYDDHFDIPKDSMKLGKTFLMLSDGENGLMPNSYRLLGWGFYEKFDKGIAYLAELVEKGEEGSLAMEAYEEFKNLLDNITTSEAPDETKPKGEVTLEDFYPYITAEQKQAYTTELEELNTKIKSANILTDNSLEPLVEEYLKNAVAQCQESDITDQKALFKRFDHDRMKRLEDEKEVLGIRKKKEELVQKLLELKVRDEKLRFFEQEEKINLGVSLQPKIMETEDVEEEEIFVNAPGERGRTL